MATPPLRSDDNDGKSHGEYISRPCTHAPISLEPFTFPEDVYVKARKLAPIFNKLVDKVARNEACALHLRYFKFQLRI
jgi:hypothetical protein